MNAGQAFELGWLVGLVGIVVWTHLVIEARLKRMTELHDSQLELSESITRTLGEAVECEGRIVALLEGATRK